MTELIVKKGEGKTYEVTETREHTRQYDLVTVEKQIAKLTEQIQSWRKIKNQIDALEKPVEKPVEKKV